MSKVISLPDLYSSHDHPPDENMVSLFYKLEKHIIEARKNYEELQKEQEINHKLKQDLSTHQTVYDRLLQERDVKNRELKLNENKMKTYIQELQTSLSEERLKTENLIQQSTTYRKELSQFKSSWAEVLRREKEARQILSETQTLQKNHAETQEELKKTQTVLENETKSRKKYQQELQDTLVKLHHEEAGKELTKRLIRAEIESEMIFEREKKITEHEFSLGQN